MRIAVCDDDDHERRQVAALLEAYHRAHPHHSFQTALFSGSDALLAALEEQPPFDLFLLDVLMPGMSGITLADRLLARCRKPRIIFLTSSSEYAVDAFRVRACNYLLKPVEQALFFAALDEALPAAEPKVAAFTIPTAQNMDLTLPLSSIAYAECIAHTVRYHLTDGNVVESRTLRVPFTQTIAPLLESGKFMIIHRSFAVNMEQVQHVTESSVRMNDGTELAVARLRQRIIREAYIDYLSRSKWGGGR